jgi:sec-independent protein translocase protein TatA
MFGEIGLDKLALLLVVLLLLFGAKRIPEIARSLGKGIRAFKDSVAGTDELPERSSAEEHSLVRGRSYGPR